MLNTTKRLALVVLLLVLGRASAWAQQPVAVSSGTAGAIAGTAADAESNTEPFLGRIGMRGYFFNGTTWDRMRGDTTSGLWVNVKNATLAVTLPANQSVNVSQINGVTPLMGAGNTGTGSPRVTVATDQAAIATWGLGATGAAVPSGGQYTAGNAITALPSAATAGNLTGASYDKFGRQVVLTGTIRDLRACQTTTISASTSETTIITAAGANVFADPYLLMVSNTSASTNTRIDFRDATAGTVLFSLQSIGGAPPAGFSLPQSIPQTTANNNWTAQAATSTTDLRVYACYEKNK